MKPLKPNKRKWSSREMTEKEVRELAGQLRKPQGEMGRLVAERMNEGNLHINEDTLNQLDLKEGHRILEIGMGNGHFVSQLLSRHPEIYYTGVDYSEDMVEMASFKNHEHVLAGKAQFVCGNVSSLPFQNGYFDNIFTINTIYFWPSVDLGMRQVSGVLKAGGQFIIAIRPAYFMKHYPVVKYDFIMYEGEEVAQLMESHGFTDLEMIFRTEPEQEVYGHKDRKESCLIIGRKY